MSASGACARGRQTPADIVIEPTAGNVRGGDRPADALGRAEGLVLVGLGAGSSRTPRRRPAPPARRCGSRSRSTSRGVLEHAVAHLVAVRVVDALEVVEVHQHQRRGPARGAGPARPRCAGARGRCGGWRGRSARRRPPAPPRRPGSRSVRVSSRLRAVMSRKVTTAPCGSPSRDRAWWCTRRGSVEPSRRRSVVLARRGAGPRAARRREGGQDAVAAPAGRSAPRRSSRASARRPG